MSDHDLRRQDREIREALARFEKEQLIQILAHVFSQYVMTGSERGGPRQVVRGGGAVDELAGLSFAKVIEHLQLRLDLPELQLFEVQEGRVSVRTGAGSVPLRAPGGASEPLPRQVVIGTGGSGGTGATGGTNAALPVAASAPVPAVANVPVLTAAASAANDAPTPASPGTSVSPAVGPVGVGYAGGPGTGRPSAPSSVAVTARPVGGPAPAAAQPPAPAAKPGAKEDKPAAAPAPAEEGGGRFSMLEID